MSKLIEWLKVQWIVWRACPPLNYQHTMRCWFEFQCWRLLGRGKNIVINDPLGDMTLWINETAEGNGKKRFAVIGPSYPAQFLETYGGLSKEEATRQADAFVEKAAISVPVRGHGME